MARTDFADFGFTVPSRRRRGSPWSNGSAEASPGQLALHSAVQSFVPSFFRSQV